MIYDDIFKILVPYASYMQTGWICKVKGTDGREHGLSSSVAIVVLAGIVIGTFFKGFFAELGKIAAQKLFEAIETKIKKQEYKSFNTNLKELNQAIEIYTKGITKYDIKEIVNAIEIGRKNVLKEIEDAGIPKSKAEIISSICIQKIKKEHLNEDKN